MTPSAYIDFVKTLIAGWAAADKSVVIYGAGEHTRMLLDSVDFSACRLIGLIDRCPDRSAEIGGLPVYSHEYLDKSTPDVILISSAAYERLIDFRLAPYRRKGCEIVNIYGHNLNDLSCFGNHCRALIEKAGERNASNSSGPNPLTTLTDWAGEEILSGETNIRCSICGFSGKSFLPYLGGDGNIRRNSQCPSCGSLERHRLLHHYLKSRSDFFHRTSLVLEMGPIDSLERIVRSNPLATYLSSDIAPDSSAMVITDLMEKGFKDNLFDYILCVHVLEHIRDESRGLLEIRRILKPDGTALIMVPVERGRHKTLEYGRPNPDKCDHYRSHGADFEARLDQAGFNVATFKIEADLASERGISETETLFVCHPVENIG
ncbi:methyltransferase domain-containing protein [candidate division KSB1 bacterium]